MYVSTPLDAQFYHPIKKSVKRKLVCKVCKVYYTLTLYFEKSTKVDVQTEECETSTWQH